MKFHVLWSTLVFTGVCCPLVDFRLHRRLLSSADQCFCFNRQTLTLFTVYYKTRQNIQWVFFYQQTRHNDKPSICSEKLRQNRNQNKATQGAKCCAVTERHLRGTETRTWTARGGGPPSALKCLLGVGVDAQTHITHLNKSPLT